MDEGAYNEEDNIYLGHNSQEGTITNNVVSETLPPTQSSALIARSSIQIQHSELSELDLYAQSPSPKVLEAWLATDDSTNNKVNKPGENGFLVSSDFKPLTRLTISEDQSAGSKYKDQILSLVFKSKEVQPKGMDYSSS